MPRGVKVIVEPSPMPKLRRVHIDDLDRDEMVAHAANPLEALYYSHQGRIAYKWHHYLELYDRHLHHFRGRPVRILELGIFSGGSLQIWKSYFGEQAVIHGIDIEPGCAEFSEERVVTHIGSQADASLLKQVVEEMGGVDVVIDDASHSGRDQIISFEVLYPLIGRKRRIYMRGYARLVLEPIRGRSSQTGHLHGICESPHRPIACLVYRG